MLCPFILTAGFASLLTPAFASKSSKCTSDSIPEQVHFNYAGPTGMTVSWNTAGKLDTPAVRYGKGSNLDKTASSDVSVIYKTSTTWNNHVFIDGLEPDTEYSYRVQCARKDEVHTFKTSLPAGHGRPFNFAFYGDLGAIGPLGLSTDSNGTALVPGQHTTIKALKLSEDDYEFIWHDGDLAYADAWLKEEDDNYLPNTTIANGYKVYERILNEFYNDMAVVTADKPWMVGPGNHEANCDNGGTTAPNGITYTEKICVEGQRNFTGYRNHFRMPSAQSGGLENFWYSWDYGMVHFVQISTETDFPFAPDESCGPGDNCAGPFAPPGTQTAWLESDLAKVDRSKTPWVIVAGHRPWYASTGVCWACQDAFEHILLKNNVDVFLTGHFHVYERNDPVKNNKTDPAGLNNPKAPWYITSGAAGHFDGLDAFNEPVAHYQVVGINSTYGYNMFRVHNCTHLSTEFISSGNGSVLDTATLYKDRDCSSLV